MACHQQQTQLDELLRTNEQLSSYRGNPKEQETRQQRHLVESDRLRRWKERVEAQEHKLRKLKTLRGQVDQQKENNNILSSDLDSIRALFNEKEKELSLAVAKVEELTRQLEELRRGRSEDKNSPPPDVPAPPELDKLRRELMYRNKLNSEQSEKLDQQRRALTARQEEMRAIDRRITELQERLHRKRSLNQQLANRISATSNKAAYQQFMRLTDYRFQPGDFHPNEPKIASIQPYNHIPIQLQANQKIKKISNENSNLDILSPINTNQHIKHDKMINNDCTFNEFSISRADSRCRTLPHGIKLSCNFLNKVDKRSHFDKTKLNDQYYNNSAKLMLNNKYESNILGDENEITYPENEKVPSSINSSVGSISPYQNTTISTSTNSSPTNTRLSKEPTISLSNQNISNNTNNCNLNSTINCIDPFDCFVANTLVEKNTKVSLSPRRIQISYGDEGDTFKGNSESSNLKDFSNNTSITVKKQKIIKPKPLTINKQRFCERPKLRNKTATTNSRSTRTKNSEPHNKKSSAKDNNLQEQLNKLAIEEDATSTNRPPGNRKVSFDPLALLLDASLEGEFDLVVETAERVENPSAPNDEGITALHNAICAGHQDIVMFLVEFGCDVNAQDNDGWTPLHCAASCNNLDLVKLLVRSGASVFAATRGDGETAAEKCEEDEEGVNGCSQYLYDVQSKLGTSSNGLVFALFDYAAQRPDELSLREGDQIRVLRKGDESEREWWWSEMGDKKGYVPRNLLGLFPRLTKSKDKE
ncbi:unnamed protein product [Phyllotreta striolata]|uniref:SH3 domain-containing protein n=1 Tax=Phyllotreta striolata TaxID=444603 RepID=A0A9N9TKK0_PHYSR|nr:unnamed protein product [Phyllotreta striolata]